MLIMSFYESFNSYLERSGLGDPFSQAFIVVTLLFIVTIGAKKMQAPNIGVIILNVLIVIFATVMGMIPLWIIVGIVSLAVIYGIIILTDIPLGGRQ